MSAFPMPPAPRGSAAEQLARQYAYLYQMAQQLNVALDGMTAASGSAAAANAPYAAAAPAEKEQYQTLKSLIVRTAKEVRAEMDKVKLELEGEDVAVSDFGTYLQKLNSTIEADAEGIAQYYRFIADLQTDVEAVSAAFEAYRVDTGGYIRTGIVAYDGALPVYGVAVGQDLSVREVDGRQMVEPKHFRALFTAEKLSFWQDAVEVAYVSNNRLYISDITVRSTVALGGWELSQRSGLAFRWIGG